MWHRICTCDLVRRFLAYERPLGTVLLVLVGKRPGTGQEMYCGQGFALPRERGPAAESVAVRGCYVATCPFRVQLN